MENRVSNSQLDELLDYLIEHQALAKGVDLGRSKETVDRQWEEITSKLNAHGRGSSKPGYRWKRYWAHLKHKVTVRTSARRRTASGTGGGPASQDDLSELDKKVLSVTGQGAAYTQPLPTSSTSSAMQSTTKYILEGGGTVSVRVKDPPTSVDPDRLQVPRSNSDSSVSRRLTRSSVRSHNVADLKTRRTVDQSCLVDLETRRIDAEQKLADAVMIIAEARRDELEISQRHMALTKSLAQALREQTNMFKHFLENK